MDGWVAEKTQSNIPIDNSGAITRALIRRFQPNLVKKSTKRRSYKSKDRADYFSKKVFILISELLDFKPKTNAYLIERTGSKNLARLRCDANKQLQKYPELHMLRIIGERGHKHGHTCLIVNSK